MLLKTKLMAVGKVLKEVGKSLCSDLNGLRSGLQRALCRGLLAVWRPQQRWEPGAGTPALLKGLCSRAEPQPAALRRGQCRQCIRDAEDTQPTGCLEILQSESSCEGQRGSEKRHEGSWQAQEPRGTRVEGPVRKGRQKQLLQPTSINEGFVSSIFELCPLSIIQCLHDSPSRLSSPQHLSSSR